MLPRPRHRSRSLGPLLLAGALFASMAAPPEPAWADKNAPSPQERRRAVNLKQQGDDSMVTLRYAEALDAYTKAYEITSDPALLYNRGRALQGLGQMPEALEQIEAFNEKAPATLKAKVPALDALLTELRAKTATITLACDIKGARVLIDNKVVATTPVDRPLRINAGDVAIQVEADGYFPYQTKIKLPGGESTKVVATLVLKSTMGTLLVASTTKGARVLIDGKPAGNVPVELSVKAGLHGIRVEHEGFEPVTTSAVVIAGDKKQVNVPLAANRPVTARWYFWTSLGVAVAGGVALTIALRSERAASMGTLSPAQIPTPPPKGTR